MFKRCWMKITIYSKPFRIIKTKEWLRNPCSTLKFFTGIWFILHLLLMLLKVHCRLFLNLVEILLALLKVHHLLRLILLMVLSKVERIAGSKECQDQDLWQRVQGPNSIEVARRATLLKEVSRGTQDNTQALDRVIHHRDSKAKVARHLAATLPQAHPKGMVAHHQGSRAMADRLLLGSSLATALRPQANRATAHHHPASSPLGPLTAPRVVSSRATGPHRPQGRRRSRAGTQPPAVVAPRVATRARPPQATEGLATAPAPARSPAPSLGRPPATAALAHPRATPARRARGTAPRPPSTPTAASPALAAAPCPPPRRPPTRRARPGRRPARATRRPTSPGTSRATSPGPGTRQRRHSPRNKARGSRRLASPRRRRAPSRRPPSRRPVGRRRPPAGHPGRGSPRPTARLRRRRTRRPRRPGPDTPTRSTRSTTATRPTPSTASTRSIPSTLTAISRTRRRPAPARATASTRDPHPPRCPRPAPRAPRRPRAPSAPTTRAGSPRTSPHPSRGAHPNGGGRLCINFVAKAVACSGTCMSFVRQVLRYCALVIL